MPNFIRPAGLFSAAQVAAGIAVLSRLSQGARRRPPLSPSFDIPSSRVSVIIPARNEEARLGRCLQSLVGQPGIEEIIVVDDESTDGTAKVAHDFGATVVEGKPVPDGAVGKPWALQQGLAAASGDLALFMDADTMARPGLVPALVQAHGDTNADLLTVGARFVCNSWSQRLLHASFLSTLVYRFGPVGNTRSLKPERIIANGQCVMAERDWLIQQGGFQVAAGNMTDDIALARNLARRGANVVFVDGADVIDVRMYESAGEIWNEWGRSLSMADVTSSRQQMLDIATVWLTLALPLPRIVSGKGSWVDKLLLMIRLALCLPLRRSYAQPDPAVMLSPLADVAAAARLTETTLRPVRTWRGRTY